MEIYFDIQVERGAGLGFVEEYAKVPRSNDSMLQISPEEVIAFLEENSEIIRIINGIVNNNEAGDKYSQMILLLEYLSIPVDKEKLIVLFGFLAKSSLKAMSDMSMALILDSLSSLAAEEIPEGLEKKTFH